MQQSLSHEGIEFGFEGNRFRISSIEQQQSVSFIQDIIGGNQKTPLHLLVERDCPGVVVIRFVSEGGEGTGIDEQPTHTFWEYR